MRTALRNLCLVLASCAIGLSLCEVSLRLFYPIYRDLAEAQFENDALRIWSRPPNGRDSIVHPDTRSPHSLHHNNFGFRQHRDFREADLDAAVNIGVFGDSFTENVYMAAPYSFTEPLDYLLNLRRGRFNVLNFGVSGYGTGQSFLHYQHFPRAGDLDHVLYVYFYNDLWDIYTRGLFHLDEEGRVEQVEAPGQSWWAPLVRGFHVTYLVLDAVGRVSFMAEQAVEENERLNRRFNDRVEDDVHLSMIRAINNEYELNADELQISLEIFRQLIRRWKNRVEDDGGAFSTVLIPRRPPQSFLVDLIRAEGIEVIDLYACFNDIDPTHSRTPWVESAYRFENDLHWNEAGNSLAAVCLYRALEEKMGFPGLSDDELRAALSRYYAAFGGENFLAFGPPGGRPPSAPPREASAEIRNKYMELDLEIMELDLEIMELLRQPDKRIISAELDVYLVQDHLVYVKDNCRPTDVEAPFFLHVTPVDNRDLPVLRRQYGTESRDFYQESAIRINDRQCAFKGELPGYPIRRIFTGQHVPGAGRLWEAEFAVEQAEEGRAEEGRAEEGRAEQARAEEGRAEEGRAEQARAEEIMELVRQPDKWIIAAEFDVYLAQDRLVYVKDDCSPTDVEAPFFLHVTPVDNEDLSVSRRQHGFDSLDFGGRSIRIDGRRCTVMSELPDYPVRGINTGQYAPGAGRLWEAGFSVEQAEEIMDLVRQPDRRIISSELDVYLDREHLVYVKDNCRPTDVEAPFFLHVTPVDNRDIPVYRRQHGFEIIDFSPEAIRINGRLCAFKGELPDYPVRGVRTGQHVPGAGGLWEGAAADMGGAGAPWSLGSALRRLFGRE